MVKVCMVKVCMVHEGVHASESYRHGFLQSFSRYLLSGVDFEKCNHDGRTPLHVAAAEGMNQ